MIKPILILLLITTGIIVLGCSRQQNTEFRTELPPVTQTKYVCPDGSTVYSSSDCPKPKLIDKIYMDPVPVNIYVRPGESAKKVINITNNNPVEKVQVTCSDIRFTEESEPSFDCYNRIYLDIIRSMALIPGETNHFVIEVKTEKDAHYNQGRDDERYVTTRSGQYSEEVTIKVYSGGQLDSSRKIPINIFVS